MGNVLCSVVYHDSQLISKQSISAADYKIACCGCQVLGVSALNAVMKSDVM
jgi:hypothetical protein